MADDDLRVLTVLIGQSRSSDLVSDPIFMAGTELTPVGSAHQ
jgi:hypothetical protein